MTVLEIAGIGPAPFAGMMLADMGAEVLRIDRIPAGKTDRFAEMLSNDGIVDRGRRSIAVDLKDPRGIEVVMRLAERSDALIEGFRPGVMEKLGLGPQACRARNARLVYGRMTGWGQTGPLAQSVGHDINYIALTGALHSIGPRDRPPPPPLNLVGDYGGGGMLLALGVVAALFEAQRSGQGQVVDAAMTDGSALLMSLMYSLRGRDDWSDRRQSNFLDGSAPFYATYECADGRFIAVGAIEPRFYAALLQRCGITDPQLQRQWSAQEWPQMQAKLAELFRTGTRDAWCTLLEGSEACVAPVLSMAEAPLHPHNVARATFTQADGVVQPSPAPRFERTPAHLPARAPAAGEHTVELLRRAGHSAEEIRTLVAAGVVLEAPRGVATAQDTTA